MTVSLLVLQRRRVYVAALFAHIVGTLAGAGGAGPLAPMPLWVQAMGLSVAATAFAVAVILWAPARRTWIEATAGGLLLAALAVRLTVLADAAQSPWIAGVLALAGTVAAHAGMQGRWWARTRVRLDWTTRQRFVTQAPPQTVWDRLVPDPACPAAHYSGTYLGQDAVPGHPGRAVQRTLAGRSMTGADLVLTTVIDVDRFDPPHRIAYVYRSGDPVPGAGPGVGPDYRYGHYALTIRPQARGSEVELQETVRDMIVPAALSAWFDDLGGEIRMSMRAALDGRRDPTLWLAGRRASPDRTSSRGVT